MIPTKEEAIVVSFLNARSINLAQKFGFYAIQYEMSGCPRFLDFIVNSRENLTLKY
jgi:hypothetical protein